MKTIDYFAYLVHEIHTTIVATNDKNGMPVTCAIDMVLYDEEGLYFLTAKGKGFYERLKQNEFLALTGIKGDDTLSCIALSLRGKVREIGSKRLSELFAAAEYMYCIYPTEESRTTLTVFQIYEGTGEWFDLSKKPIERDAFSFGNMQIVDEGYFINDACIGCKLCYSKCPQKCIDISVKPTVIRQEHCLHCGNCSEICPVRAIENRSGK